MKHTKKKNILFWFTLYSAKPRFITTYVQDEQITKTNIISGRGKRTAVIESKLRTEHSSEEKRKEHQRELAITLNEKAKERLAKQSSGKEGEKLRKSTISYKSTSQMPRENEVKELKLYVGEYC